MACVCNEDEKLRVLWEREAATVRSDRGTWIGRHDVWASLQASPQRSGEGGWNRAARVLALGTGGRASVSRGDRSAFVV